MASSRIYNLYNEIDEIVGDIDKYADGAFNVATKEAAKIAVKELKKRSLKISDTPFIKRYAAAWTFKEQKYKKFTIHNARYPSMVHLIEKPHDVISHGVSLGKKSTPHEHVKPVADSIGDMVLELTERELDKILNEKIK